MATKALLGRGGSRPQSAGLCHLPITANYCPGKKKALLGNKRQIFVAGDWFDLTGGNGTLTQEAYLPRRGQRGGKKGGGFSAQKKRFKTDMKRKVDEGGKTIYSTYGIKSWNRGGGVLCAKMAPPQKGGCGKKEKKTTPDPHSEKNPGRWRSNQIKLLGKATGQWERPPGNTRT